MKMTHIKRRDFDLDQFTTEENIPKIAAVSPIAISFNQDVIFHPTVVAKSVQLLKVGNEKIQYYLLKKGLRSKFRFNDCEVKIADLYLCCRADGSINLFPVLRPSESSNQDSERYDVLTRIVKTATKTAIRLLHNKKTKEISYEKAVSQIKPAWPQIPRPEDYLYDLCNGYIIIDSSHAIMAKHAVEREVITEEFD